MSNDQTLLLVVVHWNTVCCLCSNLSDISTGLRPSIQTPLSYTLLIYSNHTFCMKFIQSLAFLKFVL